MHWTLGGIKMHSKKDRRHNGYVSPRSMVSKEDLKRYGLFIDDFYDDWEDHRDGFREWFRDFKMIKNIKVGTHAYDTERICKRLKMNRKQEKLLRIRKARKIMKYS
jgi:hypothetical protein